MPVVRERRADDDFQWNCELMTRTQTHDGVGPLFKPTERFSLDSSSPVPLYHQMEKIILDRIAAERAVGRMLPREMDLVTIFGVSRATVKKTTDALAAKGLIERRRAIGTRIVRLGVTEDLARLTSYTEQMEKKGLGVSTELLGVNHHVPPAKIARKLAMEEGERTLCIRRLRGTSEVFPVVLLRSEIPERLGVGPDEDFKDSLYTILEDKYRIKIAWAEQHIRAGRASREEAQKLYIEPGSTVLVMERVTFDPQDRPVEWVRAVYRPEHYTYAIKLRR
jgi:GntR family transcriptional regulator